MAEILVSATDFRAHLKDLANHVASSGDSVVMERHGQRTAVLVSWEDYQLLLKHKPRKQRAPLEQPAEQTPLQAEEQMPFEQIQRLYAQTAPPQVPNIVDWRGKAGIVLWARTPASPAWDAPS